jgi:ABC-2 type transport system ATP-binding protein
LIDVRDLSVTFREGWFSGHVTALDDFSLTVREGDVYGLLGPNGAGKSTAMYCMLGLLEPDDGTVELMGEKPRAGSDLFDDVVYLPEEPHYHQHLSIHEAVNFYGDLYFEPVPEDRRRDALETVSLWGDRNRRIANCSKGMKQRLGLATCLMKDPDLLFLDEPTRGLDPVIGGRFRRALLEMNRNGTTIFLNSHVLTEVELICDRVAIVQDGRVVVEDHIDDVLEIDTESYRVTLDRIDDPPAFLSDQELTDRRLKARCPRQHVAELFETAERESFTVYECSLDRQTLEEAFLETVDENS